MNYRIVIETEKSGKEHFYVQKKNFLGIWKYERKTMDITMYKYKIHFKDLDEAKSYIDSEIESLEEYKNSKIVRREYKIIKK